MPAATPPFQSSTGESFFPLEPPLRCRYGLLRRALWPRRTAACDATNKAFHLHGILQRHTAALEPSLTFLLARRSCLPRLWVVRRRRMHQRKKKEREKKRKRKKSRGAKQLLQTFLQRLLDPLVRPVKKRAVIKGLGCFPEWPPGETVQSHRAATLTEG